MTMILAVNIGNTNVAVALWDQTYRFFYKIRTRSCSINVFINQIKKKCIKSDIFHQDIKDCVLSSVIPDKTEEIATACTQLTGKKPCIVDVHKNPSIHLAHYDTTLLGADRVMACVGALKKVPAPLVVFDFGTATTVNVLAYDHTFLGGAILPGIHMGLNALGSSTASLPTESDLSHVALVGASTSGCLKSGAIFGAVGMLSYYCAQLKAALGEELSILVTGGGAKTVLRHCNQTGILFEPKLVMDGIIHYYEANRG